MIISDYSGAQGTRISAVGGFSVWRQLCSLDPAVDRTDYYVLTLPRSFGYRVAPARPAILRYNSTS